MKQPAIPFGRRGSITGRTLNRLPEAMQAEGLMLMREMGLSREEMARDTGWTLAEVGRVLKERPAPYRRGGEDIASYVRAEEGR